MLRLRPFRVPDAKTIITWQREPEEFYMWTAGGYTWNYIEMAISIREYASLPG